MITRILRYKNHQNYTTNRRKSVKKSECTPSLLKEGQSNKRKKELITILEILGNSKNCWNFYLAKLIAATFQDRKKIIKVCIIA